MARNAIFSVVRGGMAWRSLPREYPSWATVYGDVRRRRLAGVWPCLTVRLRSLARQHAGLLQWGGAKYTEFYRRFSDGLGLLASERMKRMQAIIERYTASSQRRRIIDEIFENLCGRTISNLIEETAAAVLEEKKEKSQGIVHKR